jgi:hypothetical protein
MKTALLAGAIIAGLSSAALAKIEKLSEVAWWAAHGGLREDGAFVCAMVTSTPDGRDGKLVIEYVKGTDVFRIRMLKPTWAIPQGSQKRVSLRFGYGQIWNIDTIGSATELTGVLPLRNLEEFLSGFQSAGRIDLTFIGGSETPWSLATGGGGIVAGDFLRCIRMSVPVKPPVPTQP